MMIKSISLNHDCDIQSVRNICKLALDIYGIPKQHDICFENINDLGNK